MSAQGKPWDQRVGWTLYVSAWILIASMFFAYADPGAAYPLSFGLFGAAAGPLLYRLILQFEGRGRLTRLLLLGLLAPALTGLSWALEGVLTMLRGSPWPTGLDAAGRHLLLYGALASGVHSFVYLQRSRGHAMHTSNLQAQLAEARLQSLKAQLHPHFLFNTLNAISALMHRDVDSADRMIALLSDLLRASLDQDERHEVSLKEELAILEKYLAIERIRFRDRLTVEIDVEPECQVAMVPRLILQPLVENSIIHGIALHSTAGLIAIRARRKGNRLTLAVSDDGPGLINHDPSSEGVGLSNTRRRLAELYGTDHRFALQRAPLGGLEVLLEMPFEHRPRFPTDRRQASSENRPIPA